ncbi:metallophosphoesterase family protein [Jeotgalibacillus aurantiacus]|uniref:metallophosphoesterase family protein n=1 Tax=Jeotgalibacillus aurantiacus TaxID=2763266 RepID=UPI001D0A47AC|nr:metallophosphoesterase family protein [Jeotgalibacillus aurantiacus]
MKIVFLSDIHGNAQALEQSIGIIKTIKPDKIIVLGDLCFRGADPSKVLEILHDLKPDIVIKGNADEWIVRGFNKGEINESTRSLMEMERDWVLSQLTHQDLSFLQQLPTTGSLDAEGYKLNFFHATPVNLFDVVPASSSYEQFNESFDMNDNNSNIYVYGHIHDPFYRKVNKKHIINTGSIGLPLDQSSKGHFAVLEINKTTLSVNHFSFPLDREAYLKSLEVNKYPNLDIFKQNF